MKTDEQNWDVVVIGGGPAGMMAAGTAAKNGKRVLLLEKNDTLGKKLLISGGGRCNVTNAEFNTKVLLGKYKDADKFLASPFSQWSAQETISFFEGLGMPTKVEPGNRVFPVSDSSQSVWDALVAYMLKGNVTVRSKSPVSGFEVADDKISGVRVRGSLITGTSYVLATGGLSRPETGSTGEGFEWLKEIGHTVNIAEAALVPIKTKESWVKTMAGVALDKVKITTFQNNAKQQVALGKVLFTHVGLSGPAILNMSSEIGELLKYGEVHVELDLLPTFDYGQLNERLQLLFKRHHTKKIKNALADIIPTTCTSIVLWLAGIDEDKACNSVTRDERNTLVKALKHIRMEVTELLGLDMAVVTSGGVILEEVDWKTMQSRKYSNLFLVGDVLDIDRPSGGYSLQVCWTTGFVAGSNA